MWKLRLIVLGSFVLAASVFFYWRQRMYPFLELMPGRLEIFTSSIAPNAAGRIAEVGPQEGDFVRRGEMLFALDRALLKVRSEQIELEGERVQERIRSEQALVEKAMEAYLAEIAVPDSARNHLIAMEEAQVRAEAAKHEWACLRDELQAIQLQMAEKTYTAPFDAVVLRQAKPSGAIVPEGEEVYLLADPQRVWAETSLAETELSKVAIGMKARIRLSAYRNKEWSGEVSWIAPATLEKEPRVPVRIAIDHPDPGLKPGLSAKVVVQIH